MVIPQIQPNIVDKMHIQLLSFNSWNMYVIVFQGGIKVCKIIFGDGLWHID